MERPIELILQEEQAKLFFHNLISHLESQGYKQGTWGSGINEEGRWEERDLFYEYSNSFGNSDVELHIDKRIAIVNLSEYSFDNKARIHEFWTWKLNEYKHAEVIEKLEQYSQVHELFSSSSNNPQTQFTEMEYKENLERQLNLFKEPIIYLRQLGFKLENKGCLDIQLQYRNDECGVSIELGENEGLVMAEVYESFTGNDHHCSTNWTESTKDYNSTDMIRRLGNSFHFSGLNKL